MSHIDILSMKRVVLSFCFLVCCFVLFSCKKEVVDTSIIDPDANLSRKEFIDFMTLRDKNSGNSDSIATLSNKGNPPNISRLLVSPPPPSMGNGNLISFSVTEEVPIKDVLIELGRVADIDIEVDPSIRGGIILKVTNKPLDVVVKRIADLAGLKYTYTNNILRFERDLPYTQTYDVDFLIDNDVWATIESAINDIISLNAPSNVTTDVVVDNGDATATQQQAQPARNGDSSSNDYKIIINKQSSMITIYANEKTQRAVKEYIDHVKVNYSSQVLIEAKVVEVILDDNYQAGIDWSIIKGSKDALTMGYADGSYATAAGGISGHLTTKFFSGSLTAAVNALQKFGITKTISSPRVHAINNQKADLKFITKLVYFSLEKDEDQNNTTGDKTTTYTSTKQEEDIGVTLSITPSIDLEHDEVTLKVLPELKVKVGEVEDPSNILNVVPEIQTRSVETSLKVKSGNILVIGGLMSEDNTNTDTGIPILSGIPVVNWFFKSTTRTKEIKETVIFIKATIIRPNGDIGNHDTKLYKKYGLDTDNY
jgi:MSHA type pilus biogenesis protein MshL